MNQDWLNFVKHDRADAMTNDLVVLGQSLNNQHEMLEDEEHTEGDIDADIVEAEAEADVELELDDDDDVDDDVVDEEDMENIVEVNVRSLVGVDVAGEIRANLVGDDDVEVEVDVGESDETDYVDLQTDIDIESIVDIGGEVESEIGDGNGVINMTEQQELIWSTETDAEVEAEIDSDIDFDGDADFDADADVDVDADDNLRKYRMMGELIEIIDSMQAEKRFCDFFNQRIIEYFALRKRYLTVRPIDWQESRNEVKQRFADAMSYLDRLVANDDAGMAILEVCLEKFSNERDELLNATLKCNDHYDNVMKLLTAGEPNALLCESLLTELKDLGALRASVFKLQHELTTTYQFNDENYASKLSDIKLLLAEINLFNPQHVATTNTLIINRMSLFTEHKARLNNELNDLLNNIVRQHSEAEARDLALAHALEQEATESEEQYEQTTNAKQLIELSIVPSPHEQQRLNKLALTELPAQCSVVESNRERFNRWFRSIGLAECNDMQNVQFD